MMLEAMLDLEKTRTWLKRVVERARALDSAVPNYFSSERAEKTVALCREMRELLGAFSDALDAIEARASEKTGEEQ